MSKNRSEWRELEEAVTAFLAALGANARVRHNARLPDRHTQRPRQRDVWIDVPLFDHFPISVLVSCKRWSRKLHQGNIDTFNGELASSRAHLGVIYSYSGFTKPAIEKAKQLGICCCRLYRGEAPELPEVLVLTAYCCSPELSLSLSPLSPPRWDFEVWRDLFDLPVITKQGPRCVLDELIERFHEAEEAAVQVAKLGSLTPEPFRAEVDIPSSSDAPVAMRLTASGRWKFYQAKLEAYLVNGSYEFTSGNFKGEIATPWIDRFGEHPGPGWERLQGPPENIRNIRRNAVVMMILHHCGDIKEVLTHSIGPKKLAADRTI